MPLLFNQICINERMLAKDSKFKARNVHIYWTKCVFIKQTFIEHARSVHKVFFYLLFVTTSVIDFFDFPRIYILIFLIISNTFALITNNYLYVCSCGGGACVCWSLCNLSEKYSSLEYEGFPLWQKSRTNGFCWFSLGNFSSLSISIVIVTTFPELRKQQLSKIDKIMKKTKTKGPFVKPKTSWLSRYLLNLNSLLFPRRLLIRMAGNITKNEILLYAYIFEHLQEGFFLVYMINICNLLLLYSIQYIKKIINSKVYPPKADKTPKIFHYFLDI